MSPKCPPLGVRLTADIEEVCAPRGTVWWARVRWHDPESGRRESIKRSHSTHEAAATWITQMQNASRTGVDATQTLAEYVTFIGDRWTRGIDPTSTYDPYSAGLRLRVVPTLGHIPVAMITAGLVDRAIDQWETKVRAVDYQEHGLSAGPSAERGGPRRHHRSQPGNGPSPSQFGVIEGGNNVG